MSASSINEAVTWLAPCTAYPRDMGNHVFVRPATALDAQFIGAIHAQTMHDAIVAALGKDPEPEIAQVFVPEAFSRQWEQAITDLPSPEHAVLTAVDEGKVVGFAAVSPTHVEAADGEEPEEELPVVVEITALEVPPENGRAGHGSRLLAAATDLASEQGANIVQMWVLAGDDAHTDFLHSAGFAPTGLRRSMQIGSEEATEHCWYAMLSEA